MQNSLQNPSHGGNLTWAASIAGCSPLTILDFSASINPLGPPASVLEAIQAHFVDLSHYPDPGYYPLRHALARSHQLSPDWILPGNGAAELLTWAGRELAALKTTALFTPAFGDYRRALQAYDAHITPYPFTEFAAGTIDLDRLATLLPAPPGQSGLLLNTPHNPTGQIIPLEAILPLLEQFALVVVDEAFMDFLPPPQPSLVAVVEQYPNLVILRSLTKFYSLPGLRLGYAIAHPDRLHRWQQWRDPWSVNVLAVAAAIAALQDTDFQQRTWNWLSEARSHLFQGLAALPGLHPFPGVANFLLVQSDRSVTALQKRLLVQDQVFIRDCLSFPELGDRFFRVAVRTQAENQRLLDGLKDGLEDGLEDGL